MILSDYSRRLSRSPEDNASDAEMVDVVLRILRRMHPRDADAFLGHAVLGLTLDEIGGDALVCRERARQLLTRTRERVLRASKWRSSYQAKP